MIPLSDATSGDRGGARASADCGRCQTAVLHGVKRRRNWQLIRFIAIICSATCVQPVGADQTPSVVVGQTGIHQTIESVKVSPLIATSPSILLAPTISIPHSAAADRASRKSAASHLRGSVLLTGLAIGAGRVEIEITAHSPARRIVAHRQGSVSRPAPRPASRRDRLRHQTDVVPLLTGKRQRRRTQHNALGKEYGAADFAAPF